MAELNEEKDRDDRFEEKEQALKNERKRRQDAEQRLEETEKKFRRLEKSKPKEMKEQQDENGEQKEIRVSELEMTFYLHRKRPNQYPFSPIPRLRK